MSSKVMLWRRDGDEPVTKAAPAAPVVKVAKSIRETQDRENGCRVMLLELPDSSLVAVPLTKNVAQGIAEMVVRRDTSFDGIPLGALLDLYKEAVRRTAAAIVPTPVVPVEVVGMPPVAREVERDPSTGAITGVVERPLSAPVKGGVR
jgi:hypothetical protein